MYKTTNEISDPEEGGRAIALPYFAWFSFLRAPDAYDLITLRILLLESNKTRNRDRF